MDSDQAARQRLIEHLNALRREAGNPSLAWLEQLSDHKLVKTTLDDHLSGRRVGLPSWQIVAAYVAACRRAAEATGLDPRELGSLQDWHSRYQAALERDPQAPCPIQTLSAIAKESTAPLEIGDDLTATIPSVVEMSSLSPDTEDLLPEVVIRHNDAMLMARPLPRESAILLVTRGPAAGRYVIVNEDITTVGRDPASDFWLDDMSVSRRHSTVMRKGSQFTIRDVGSRNGTFVNQQSIDTELLKSGDVLHIGVVRLVFFPGGSAVDGQDGGAESPARH